MKKLSFFLMAMLVSLTSFAAEVTETVTMKGFAGLSTSAYENVTKTGTSDKGTEMVAYAFNPSTGQVRGNKTVIAGASITSSDANKNWSLYNTQAMPGAIKSIKITCAADGNNYFKNNMYVALGTSSQGAVTTISGAQKNTTASNAEFTFDIDVTKGYTYFKLLSTEKFTTGSVTGVVVTITYEAADNYVAVPSITGETYFKENTTVTLTASEGQKVYYTLDGTEPTNASTEYTAPFELTETTTVKAIAYQGENASEVAEQVFKKMQVLTCAEAAALTPNGDKYIVRGYVTQANEYSTQYNNIDFFVADTKDGGEVLKAYRAIPVTEEDKAVKVGDYVEIIGVLSAYNGTVQVAQGGTYTIIPEPVAEPTTETIYFINAKKWAKVNVYAWTTDPIVAWPGAAATKEAEQIAGYDVYSYTLNAGAAANVIFNDGSSQTPDLVWTAGKYYVIDMGWLTKEEAETKLAAPLPETWNIVGAAGLMGKDWDLNAAENAMTKQEDGTYKLEKKDITITAGSYEYKAAKDHGWDVSVPSGQTNQKLTISKSGIYDVTFVLDVTAKKLTATATLKKEAVVIPTVIIAGDMNSWNKTKDKFTMSADSLTATFKATLAVKNYGFKMIVGGAWHSDGKTITRAANSTKFTGANSNTNSTLKADIAGEYLFTWEYATKTLTVTYPALPVKYNVTVTAENGTVTGAGTYEEGKEATLTATAAEGYEFTCWTVGEDTVSTANPYKFTVTADLALVANFELIPPTKYNVTVTAENGTVEGAGEYEENAEATLTATAAEGYEFVNWTVGDSIVSTENPYKFTVTADLALVANFKEVVKAIEVKVTDATATSGEWSINLAGSWNDQALTIKLWQDNTQGFGSYAPNTETGYYILLGAKELTPTTEGVYADNGDGTFTFTCSATEGTTQYNITVIGNNPTQGGGDEEYPIIDDAITNLTFNLDKEPYSCMGGPSEEYGIELYLVLGEEDGMGTFTLTEASEIYVQGSPATFISGYLTDIDTSAPAANAVIVAKLPDGSTFEFHIAMSSTPVDATVIVVENATLAIDSTFLFNNPVSGDVYEYALTMSGNWTDSTNTTYLVTVEFPVYDPATTEEQERLANIKVGDFAADDAPFLGMVEDFLTITNVNGVITAKGLVSGNGLAFDITISGSLAQDPSTGVESLNGTVAPVKVIENGQLIIIKNGVEYNVQGAQL